MQYCEMDCQSSPIRCSQRLLAEEASPGGGKIVGARPPAETCSGSTSAGDDRDDLSVSGFSKVDQNTSPGLESTDDGDNQADADEAYYDFLREMGCELGGGDVSDEDEEGNEWSDDDDEGGGDDSRSATPDSRPATSPAAVAPSPPPLRPLRPSSPVEVDAPAALAGVGMQHPLAFSAGPIVMTPGPSPLLSQAIRKARGGTVLV
eukprot:TRINITY_DN57871_c0_g1_i1.p1 TRINITY_DN57871_c0_g1~~TRINITY_DN57871_c0_g1_i1.p1  ORF type:complete len:205 (-),score=40.10 TRINITY_DN57871_c0_g1_i1:29-643(-)